MSWIWATLLPHPPVLVPEVGQGREHRAAETLAGLAALRALLVSLHADPALTPEALLVISPHLPYAPDGLLINTAPGLEGTLGRFGAPGVAISCRGAREKAHLLAEAVRKAGMQAVLRAIPDISPDHGSLVPLHLLAPCFPDAVLPQTLLVSPMGLSPEQAYSLGRLLRDFSGDRRWGAVASGDLSHRILPGGPNGYSPDGAVFDNTVVRALEKGAPDLLLQLPESVRANAGECGLRSVLCLLGLCAGPLQVLSYEAPFGVGYAVACRDFSSSPPRSPLARPQASRLKAPDGSQACGRTHPEKPSASDALPALPALARLAVERALDNRGVGKDDLDALCAKESCALHSRAACFVSIKTRSGELRGCMGTILPAEASLGREIVKNAVTAAFRDPRFPPLRPEELQNMRFSVDVLGLPEPVTGPEELDPRFWGVIVSRGPRRGLLLPDLEGVDTVDRQLAIAAQKAGLNSLEGVRIERFSVVRHSEQDG